MVDPLLPMTLGVGASLVKVLLQANGYATAANLVGVAKEGCGILSWWKNQGGDADDQLAKQIAEILADKTRSMYEACRGQGIDKEQLEGVITEVEILFNKVVENDELLLLAVENPASFSEVLQGDIGQRRKNIESRLEPYFDKLVEAAVDEYVKLAPWSPKFQIEALKYISDKVCEILGISIEILENSIKSLGNDKVTHEELDDLPNKIASVVKDCDYSQERVLGPDHFDTLTARNNLAGAYKDVGRFGEAIELYKRVLADQERILGFDHPDTLTARNNLAGAYDSAGRFGEAIELYKRVLADQERVLGPDHPDTLTVRNNLAVAYKSAGRFGEAIELFERVLAEYECVLGADHPDTLITRNNLACAYDSAGRFGEAIELYERVLADQEQVLGPDHPDTLTTRNNLACAYDSAGRFGEAIELYERVLADQEQVLGPDHPETLDVRDNLAGAYDSVGRLAEAIDAWEKLLPDCQRVLGLGHPLTKLVQKNLEAAKRKMNPPDAPSPETGED